MGLVQEQQWSVTVTIDNRVIAEAWDGFDGGEVTSDARTYRAGGMAAAEALPSLPTTDDVTVSRGYRAERDAALEKWLYDRIGAPIVITRQALDYARNAIPGALVTFSGVLKSISSPTHNSEGDAVTRLQIVAAISGVPT